ncbi:hypothetical protein A3A40_03280 [Candidatus Kaiserbacteria bacterium RIFCSPLOWO2_01_FULL_54_20]|uniref:Uncharacterized protein n=1 Tax=Candidatus Kaiserbacteria bacterium RIFCSPLOWO2_01_FULL_54_20 TaxID=1798513 RepID=A0A1F6EKK5_9BACT|nr:MAG: hypothetical protein A3A40_03280 [Candidatus Kaiserbacteria bacterium RIFCSPLOWO2_01_FULL_54_20]
MNSITNSTVRNLSIALATLLLVAVSFAVAPKAQAADLGGWDDVGYFDMSEPTYGGGGWDDVGYYDMSQPSYDSYYDDYYTPSSGGYGGGSFFGGSGFMGSSGFTRPGNVNSNTNINENTCTNGSCNQNINAPTNIVTNYPAQQTYPVYQPVPTYPMVYVPPAQPYYQQPIAYNNRPAPYVTLSAVPYTGLDLGPWGTAMYWGFLVLWCLIAAYLIAVKKIQNKIAAWFVGGTEPSQNISSQKVLGSASPQPDHFAQKYSAPKLAGIDPFIQSQINRAK